MGFGLHPSFPIFRLTPPPPRRGESEAPIPTIHTYDTHANSSPIRIVLPLFQTAVQALQLIASWLQSTFDYAYDAFRSLLPRQQPTPQRQSLRTCITFSIHRLYDFLKSPATHILPPHLSFPRPISSSLHHPFPPLRLHPCSPAKIQPPSQRPLYPLPEKSPLQHPTQTSLQQHHDHNSPDNIPPLFNLFPRGLLRLQVLLPRAGKMDPPRSDWGKRRDKSLRVHSQFLSQFCGRKR